MVRGVVPKSPKDWSTQPNLLNYEEARKTFTWDSAKEALGGRINMAEAAVDRHAEGPLGDKVALSFLRLDQGPRTVTYRELKTLSDRFANVLTGLGLKAGDRVFALLGRVPELYVSALGTLKHRCVFCPLFSAFGPDPIQARMDIGGARVLVTTPSLYRRKVEPIRMLLPSLEFVLLLGDQEMGPGTLALNSLMATVEAAYEVGPTLPEERDPLHLYVAKLTEENRFRAEDLIRLEAEVALEIRDAVAYAEAGPLEPAEDVLRDVMAEVN